MRAIDADALDDILADGEIKARKNRKYVLESAINTIRGNLAQMPTIARPEIIHCRKCKHWVDNDGFNHDKGAECEVMRMWMQPGDYCSYVKKREEAEE